MSRWDRFWFEPVPSHVYALLRIGFGILGCATLLGLSNLPVFWDLDGLVPDAVGGGGLKTFVRDAGFAGAAGRILFVLYFVALASMTVGFQSEVSVVVAFGMSFLHLSWNPLPLSGADDVTRGVLFCLIWADCGSVWSVDAWRRRRRGEPDTAPPVGAIAPLRLIRFQVALIYLNSGLWKLLSPAWRDGSALYYVLNSNVFHRFPQGLPESLNALATIGTYGTMLWEIAFPFLLMSRPTRRLALGAGVVIHLGIIATIEIGLFSFVMLVSYIAFVDPSKVPRMFDRLSRWLPRSASNDASGAFRPLNATVDPERR